MQALTDSEVAEAARRRGIQDLGDDAAQQLAQAAAEAVYWDAFATAVREERNALALQMYVHGIEGRKWTDTQVAGMMGVVNSRLRQLAAAFYRKS